MARADSLSMYIGVLQELTNAARFLGGPLVVLLAGDVLLPHQLKCRQALKVQPVPVTKASPLTFAVRWDTGVTATALVNFYMNDRHNREISQQEILEIDFL